VVSGKTYWRCPACELTFLDPSHRLNSADEAAVYDLHDNRVDDPGYRGFLSRLSEPLLARLSPQSQVLDYGCGPGPALAAMLTEAGHECTVYDPFYAPDEQVLSVAYDAVTCTEAAEHFYTPGVEFDRLAGLLKPGAWLGVMTCLQTDDAAFADWHYRRDPTHVCFYRQATLQWLAEHYGWELTLPRKDVALFQRPDGSR
jgi:2-polyprenyl-3-methyl-5-hydroxy-6-metoxy-1,4-benzoquinol methylase